MTIGRINGIVNISMIKNIYFKINFTFNFIQYLLKKLNRSNKETLQLPARSNLLKKFRFIKTDQDNKIDLFERLKRTKY